MEAWQRYLKKENKKRREQKINTFRSYGDLSNNSIITDIYNKKNKKNNKRGL